MKASEFPFEVGSSVVISHDWGEKELGILVKIPDGAEIDSVEIEFNDGSIGEYRPEDCEKGPT
jgi:hypothetical protein